MVEGEKVNTSFGCQRHMENSDCRLCCGACGLSWCLMTSKEVNGFSFLHNVDVNHCSVLERCAAAGGMVTVSLMLFPLFRVRRQPMSQDLVEFQCRAVNTQQIVTITDDIHVVGVLHATTSKTIRTVRVGKRTKEQRTSQKAKPSSAVPIAGGGTHLTICVGPTGVVHNIPTLPYRER